jgi:ribonuclease VapC
MVVDTSAVVAILTSEPGAARFVRALDEATSLQISAASVLEVAIVLESRYGESARRTFDRWMETTPIDVVVVTRHQVEAAREGFRRFGKGRHPAALNFGDCFSYGLTKALGETLLFAGNDFARTDLRAALPPSAGQPR